MIRQYYAGCVVLCLEHVSKFCVKPDVAIQGYLVNVLRKATNQMMSSVRIRKYGPQPCLGWQVSKLLVFKNGSILLEFSHKDVPGRFGLF